MTTKATTSTPSCNQVTQYLSSSQTAPLALCGDASEVLSKFPDECLDFCMTSPPYWGHREYAGGGIGQEATYLEYIDNLLIVFGQVKRVLKPTGSFWLNIGDSYDAKRLIGIPWRICIALTDQHGWVLRNSVIWNKVKGGPDNSKDKLRCVHENIFHLVKQAKGYFYDADAIRTSPGKSRIVNGKIISATGVSGVKYRSQIELSAVLTQEEKITAHNALDEILANVANGKLSDFRMIIRGQQRATHSDSANVSGRAKELNAKGFYFLKYHPNGPKPSDVWDIMPEDTQNRGTGHFASYPEDLCRIPILATCPVGGIALDPFSGTGTTLKLAHRLGRKSIGIDICESYVSG